MSSNDHAAIHFDHATTGEAVLSGHDLADKTIVVTGASSGLGAETAKQLAAAGGFVILGVRDLAAGEKVAQDIRSRGGRAQVGHLDLADLASVRAFAEAIDGIVLNALVNNAGVMAVPYGRTRQGFEMQIGVNHFGHFLLTRLLTPALRRGAPSRVVQLSSAGHLWSDIRWDDMHFESGAYDPWLAYGQSKTANILFAVEMTRLHGTEGVFANVVMPGRITETGLGRYADDSVRKTIPAVSVAPLSPDSPANLRPKSLAQGVATSLWALVAPEFEARGGYYLEDCAVASQWDASNPRRGVKPYALDEAAATRLWEITKHGIGSL